MKKAFLAILLAACLLIGMIPGSVADDTKTLQMLWFSDGQEGIVMQGLIDQYEAAHPGIRIELVEVPYADLNNKVTTMLNAGEQPALARMTTVGQFAPYYLNLDEAIGADFRDRFAETTAIIVDDACMASTMEYTAAGVIYNKTAFEKAGVQVPTSIDDVWTWEEFEEALLQVMEKGDVKYGLAVDKTVGRFWNFFYQAGAHYLNDDGTSAFDSAETRRAIQYLYDLHKKGIIPASVWMGAENPNTMFRSGQVACHIGGSWLLTSYDKEITDVEWGVTYLPKDAMSAVQSAGKYLVAFKDTGLEKEAAEFIDWFCTPEIMNQYLEPLFFISNLTAKAEGTSESKYADAFAVFADEIAANESVLQREQANAMLSKLNPDLLDLLSACFADQITIDEAVKEFNAILEEAIADQE